MTRKRFYSRRRFISTSSGLAASLALSAESAAQALPIDEVETATQQVVDQYLSASTDLSSNRLGDFLAEDVTYEYAGMRFEGRESLLAARARLVGRLTTRRYEVRRSTVMGHVLLQERIDMLDISGREVRFHVASVFVVMDDQITEWREYPWPGVD